MTDISIHSPHAGRDIAVTLLTGVPSISIHSPHAGRDFQVLSIGQILINFNPLSPCGERRMKRLRMLYVLSFQSTLPMRGETCASCHLRELFLISIHSPHAGRDRSGPYVLYQFFIFQSTLPMRGETAKSVKYHDPVDFNPLSPCGERHWFVSDPQHRLNFNPLSPCGERQIVVDYFNNHKEFQSTLPMRGETQLAADLRIIFPISIHSPHAGRDLLERLEDDRK